MEVKRLAETFVGEVTGIDLARPRSEAEFAPIRDAFHDNSVLVFHGQAMSPDRLIAFIPPLNNSDPFHGRNPIRTSIEGDVPF